MRDQLRIPLGTQLGLTLQRHLQGLKVGVNRKVTRERESSRPAEQSGVPVLTEDVPLPHLFLLDMKIGR